MLEHLPRIEYNPPNGDNLLAASNRDSDVALNVFAFWSHAIAVIDFTSWDERYFDKADAPQFSHLILLNARGSEFEVLTVLNTTLNSTLLSLKGLKQWSFNIPRDHV